MTSSSAPVIPGIQLRDLSLGLGPRRLGHLTLEVALGETVALVGASETGKSALLLALAGLEGTVCGGTARVPRPIGMVFARDGLEDDRTALENLLVAAMPSRRAHDDSEEMVARRCAAMLIDLGIPERDHHRACALLSFGQRRRVGLARALVVHPATLLLDDPTAGLDPDTARAMLEAIRCHAGQAAVVIATQDIDVVLPSVPRCVVCTADGPSITTAVVDVDALSAPFRPEAFESGLLPRSGHVDDRRNDPAPKLDDAGASL